MLQQFSEKTRKTVEQLNVIDDILFRKMAEDVSFCEEVISTIMEQKITILEVTDQKDITNLQGRSVILDALCIDENGKHYNIEVQKPDVDDHQRRVRYNASCITSNYSKKGTPFEKIPDVAILFISTFDIFKSGKTTYHIDRVIRETGTVVENGLTEIYVNASVDDGSDISKLMEIFTDSSKYDFEKFPKVSARKQQFKIEEKGDAEMCTLVEEYAKEYAKEAVAEAIAKNSVETAVKTVDRISNALNIGIEEACQLAGITVEKYNEYKKKKIY